MYPGGWVGRYVGPNEAVAVFPVGWVGRNEAEHTGEEDICQGALTRLCNSTLHAYSKLSLSVVGGGSAYCAVRNNAAKNLKDFVWTSPSIYCGTLWYHHSFSLPGLMSIASL